MLSEVARKSKLLKLSLTELKEQRLNKLKTSLAKGLDEEIRVLKDIKQVAKVCMGTVPYI